MWERKKGYSLRYKLFISVVAVVVLFLSISTYFSIDQTGAIILDQINSYGKSLSFSVGNSSIENLLSMNYPSLHNEVTLIGEADTQILKIEVHHNDKTVAEYISPRMLNESEPVSFYEYNSPILARAGNQEIVLGSVKLLLSQEKYQQFLRQEIIKSLIFALALLAGDVIVSYYTILFFILRPLHKITEGAEIIGGGNLDYRLEVKEKDEIGYLANTINLMTTNLQKSRNEIEESKDKISAMVSNFIDPVIVIDDRKITLFNPAASRIFGLEKSDLGRMIGGKIHPECLKNRLCLCDFKNTFRVKYFSKVLKYGKEGFPVIEELVVENEKDPDRNLVFKVFTSPVIDTRGRKFGHMKVFYDLTREKTIDALKSKFIFIAAHQLRTPLSGIKWSLDMMLRKELGTMDSEVENCLNKTYEANERMIKLVNDLLNVSQIEEGYLLKNIAPVEIEKVVKEVISGLSVTTEKNKIKVVFKKISPAISKILGDKDKLALAVQNLLDNAIKYSKKGGQIDILLTQINEGDKEFLELQVADQGIGIPEKDQKKIFSKFFRADNAFKVETEGSGLGLYIVNNIVKAHHGSVSFRSVEGQGTSFVIKIPIEKE